MANKKCDQKFIDKCKAAKGDSAYVYYDSTNERCMCGKKVKDKKGRISYYAPKSAGGGEIK